MSAVKKSNSPSLLGVKTIVLLLLINLCIWIFHSSFFTLHLINIWIFHFSFLIFHCALRLFFT